MKKVFFLLTAVGALTFTSCDNENTTNPEPLGDVTIKGTIVSEMDEEEDPGDLPLEKIGTGVNVYAQDNATGAVLATATTTNGEYTFTLKIGAPRNIKIVVGDFTAEINVYDAVEADFVKKQAIYSDRQSAVITGVVKGGTYIQNIEINQPTVIDFE